MNVLTFSGNLGRDCNTNNVGGTAVANFAVAVKSGFGENEQTVWVDCALWGKRAEGGLVQYLTKGRQVVVSGEMGTREFEKDGEKRFVVTCRVSDITLVGKRDDAQQGHQGGYGGQPRQQQPAQQPQQGYQNQHTQQQAAPQQQYQQPQRPAPQQPQQGGQNFDSDIPFAPLGKQYRALLNCM